MILFVLKPGSEDGEIAQQLTDTQYICVYTHTHIHTQSFGIFNFKTGGRD